MCCCSRRRRPTNRLTGRAEAQSNQFASHCLFVMAPSVSSDTHWSLFSNTNTTIQATFNSSNQKHPQFTRAYFRAFILVTCYLLLSFLVNSLKVIIIIIIINHYELIGSSLRPRFDQTPHRRI